jgi:hypothetical protein
MGRRGSFSIKQKITALILGACGVVLFLSASVFVATQIASYKRMLVEELITVSNIIGNNITAAMVFEDDQTAKEILAALKSKPGIVWARIHRPDKTLFVQYQRPSYQRPDERPQSGDAEALLFAPHTRESGYDIDIWEERIDLQAPITLDGEIIGALLIRSDLQAMYAQIDTYLLLAALTIVVGRPAGSRIGKPRQVRIPGQHEPRAAYAPQRHHRLLGNPQGRDPRVAGHRALSLLCSGYLR